MRQRSKISLASVFFLLLSVTLALAAIVSETNDYDTGDAALLTSHMPVPERVYIRKTTAYPDLGNVLVSVQLSAEQKEEKKAAGEDFITFGKNQDIILRDDGLGGDEVADDALFTGIAYIDESDLQARSQEDQSVRAAEGSKEVPVFNGREITHFAQQQPFDYSAFAAGQRVVFDQAVTELESADTKPSTTPVSETRIGGATGSVTAAALPPPPGMTLPQPTPSPGATNTFQERVLIIRNASVVQDAARTYNPCTNTGTGNGVWTFHHLMVGLANKPKTGIDPAVLAERWLETWTSRAPDPVINGLTVPDRETMTQIIDQWPRTIDGTLDLNRSPLRLLAIMPRVDLRRTTGGGGYGGGVSGDPLDAGELRFIFGFVLPPGWRDLGSGTYNGGGTNTCRFLPFSVIFEYGVPACNCFDVKGWAQRWYELRLYAPSTATYRTKLEALTEQIVRAGANPRKPNESALNQLRTNEIALAAPWELREFQLTQAAFTLLNETTTADTPQDPFNNTLTVRNWMTGIIQPLLTPARRFEDPTPLVSLFFGGVNFLGAHPQVPNPGFFWTAPNLVGLGNNGGMNSLNWARHRVSRAACNGCHARETNTVFVHVDPSSPVPATISGFLSGINNVTDPAEAMGNPRRHFDDLLRRERDLRAVAKARCFRFHPINKQHVKDNLVATGRLPNDLFQGMARIPVDQRPAISVDDMNRNPISEVH